MSTSPRLVLIVVLAFVIAAGAAGAGSAPASAGAGPGADGLADNAEGMAVDGAGNVFVCGSTKVSLNATDSLLLKYDASGTLQWAKTYDPEGLSDGATAIGLDAAGDVYLAGWSERPGAKRDVYTAKFRAADGERL